MNSRVFGLVMVVVSVSLARAESVLLTHEIIADEGWVVPWPPFSSVSDAVDLRLHLNFGASEDFPDAPPPAPVGDPVLEASLFANSPTMALSSESGQAFESARTNLLGGDFSFLLRLHGSGRGGLLPAFEATDITRIELMIDAEPFDVADTQPTPEVCLQPCPDTIFWRPTLHSTLVIHGTVPEPDGNMMTIGWITFAFFLRRCARDRTGQRHSTQINARRALSMPACFTPRRA